MSAASDIYDYFTPIEDAIAAAYIQAGVTCYTPLGEEILDEQAAANPDHAQEFQKKRPRIEIALQPGANKGMLLAQAGRRVTFGHSREKARTASLQMRLITESSIIVHRAYVAKVLFLADTLAHDANETKNLTNHFLQSIRCNGGSTGYKPEDGNFETTLNFDVEFSVQEYAWIALDAELSPA